MTRLSPFEVVVFLCLILCQNAFGQNCDDPQGLCSGSGAETLSTANGLPAAIPSNFCFNAADNAVFFEFTTIDVSAFPDQTYEGDATVSVTGISCDPDADLGQSVNLAIFEAADPCDPSTFGTPLDCQTEISGSANVDLSGLDEGTTYYILISGAEDGGAINPGECEVSVSVDGPAVSFDLNANFQLEGSQGDQIILEGQTVELFADDAFPDLTWSGTGLNETQGTPVTALPPGPAPQEYTYTVTSEVDGCLYSDQVTFTLRRAIQPYSGFTPNGDGINDTWEISRIEEWENAQIIVYSRWGTKVFQATRYNNDWDGDGLPAATYYYVIELNDLQFNLEPVTGSVTIMR